MKVIMMLFLLVFMAGCKIAEPTIIRPKDYYKLPVEIPSLESVSFPWGWAVWTLMAMVLVTMLVRTSKDIKASKK
jgi:hypothetical protein